MKRDLALQRGIERTLSVYTRHVESAALSVLSEYGFLGLDPRPDAPDTFAKLRAFWNQPTRPKFFPVYDGGNDKTVFDKPTVNLLFRCWHDIGHCVLNAPFTPEGERAVAEWQAARLSGIDADILRKDVVKQVDYWYATGRYVEDQKAFIVPELFNDLPIQVAPQILPATAS